MKNWFLKLKIKMLRKQMDQEVYEKMKDASTLELYHYFSPYLVLSYHGENHDRKIFALQVIYHERGLLGGDLVDAAEAERVLKELTK